MPADLILEKKTRVQEKTIEIKKKCIVEIDTCIIFLEIR
jgi:hypothetical protein